MTEQSKYPGNSGSSESTEKSPADTPDADVIPGKGGAWPAESGHSVPSASDDTEGGGRA